MHFENYFAISIKVALKESLGSSPTKLKDVAYSWLNDNLKMKLKDGLKVA